MFGVLGDRKHRTAILAGFLSQKQHFGSLEVLMDDLSPALRLWANADGARLDPGSIMETDWACLHFLHLDTSDPWTLPGCGGEENDRTTISSPTDGVQVQFSSANYQKRSAPRRSRRTWKR
jgi:hypothetical protein